MRYWFVRKTYGYGWAPATWEGWVVLLVYLLAFTGTYLLVFPFVRNASDVILGLVLPYLLYTAVLLFVAYKKGEKLRWQWGEKK